MEKKDNKEIPSRPASIKTLCDKCGGVLSGAYLLHSKGKECDCPPKCEPCNGSGIESLTPTKEPRVSAEEIANALDEAINGLSWRIEEEPETADKSDYEKLDEWKKVLASYRLSSKQGEGEPCSTKCKYENKEYILDPHGCKCIECGFSQEEKRLWKSR